MKKLFTLFLMTAFVFTACTSKTEKETTEAPPTTAGIAKDSVHIDSNNVIANTVPDLLANVPVRHFPIMDSTRFEDLEKMSVGDNGFLKQIKFAPRRKDATNIKLRYIVPFSKNFTSVVVTYQGGEHELFTTLVTVNKENKIIDKLEIAYDEIAESAFGKTSKIEKDKIAVTSSDWIMSEEPVFETETYIVESNGKFKKVQASSIQE